MEGNHGGGSVTMEEGGLPWRREGDHGGGRVTMEEGG